MNEVRRLSDVAREKFAERVPHKVGAIWGELTSFGYLITLHGTPLCYHCEQSHRWYREKRVFVPDIECLPVPLEDMTGLPKDIFVNLLDRGVAAIAAWRLTGGKLK